jgi:integrase
MLGTGVRIGEALSVTWDDVDLSAGHVVIERAIVQIKGVGLLRTGTKSRARERAISSDLPDLPVTTSDPAA